VAARLDRPVAPVDFAPIVTQLKFSAGTFYLGTLLPRASVVRRRTIPTGTTIYFRASEPARATLTFQRISFAFNKIRFNAKAGLNRVRFHGRIDARHRLVPGLYRLEVVAVDTAGQPSAVRRVNFRALRKPVPVPRTTRR